jgi:exonuclease III
LEHNDLKSRRKTQNLKKEMQKNAVSVLVVGEVRCKGQGEIRSGDYTVYYSGGDRAERGVAIVVHKSIVKSVVKKSVYSDRIIAVKLKAETVSMLTVQVYMPTSGYEDDEVEELYDIIEEILGEVGKGETNTIIMGDWNSVVGDKAHHNTVGPYGLGRRNQRSEMLFDFCERNGLVITNIWLKNLKEDCTPENHQGNGVNFNWPMY